MALVQRAYWDRDARAVAYYTGKADARNGRPRRHPADDRTRAGIAYHRGYDDFEAETARVTCPLCVQWRCSVCKSDDWPNCAELRCSVCKSDDWPNCCGWTTGAEPDCRGAAIAPKPYWPDGTVAVITQDEWCDSCAQAVAHLQADADRGF
jgi:hypothetical protein